jgi:hypothetical protein
MGADFSSHRLFVGEEGDAMRLRASAVAELRRFFQRSGFEEIADEDKAERSVVIGPAGRWLFIGDSAGSTEWADSEGFDALALALSTQAPVVDTKMSDDATVHFYPYRDGRQLDRFGNAAFPFYRFASEEEAACYWGKQELWRDLLVDPGQVPDLRAAWTQDWQAGAILAATALLLGWDDQLLWVGYTYDDEGIPIKYDEFLRGSEADLAGFEELHFVSVGRHAE